MKFAAHLNAHITPEWRTQYVAYEVLKELLYEAQENTPAADTADEKVLEKYYEKFDFKFFTRCEHELSKVNMFFAEKLAEAERKAASLQTEVELIKNRPEPREDTSHRGSNRIRVNLRTRNKSQNQQKRKESDLKLAFSEFYLSLVLLQNYQSLNSTAFRKILKKHDKICDSVSGTQFRIKHVEKALFCTNKKIDRLIRECEEVYIRELENGDRGKAMKRLRVPPLVEKQVPRKTFLVGLFLGIFLTLLGAIVIASTFLLDDLGTYLYPFFTIYRGLFLIILFLALLGANLYGWSKNGVNHVLIFEIDPRNHISYPDLLEMSFILGAFWGISVLVCLCSHVIGIKAYISPLVCVCSFFVIFINPLPIFKKRARFWLLKYLFRVFAAPCYIVTFPDFWLADQLNSLTQVILDLELMVCFYAYELDWSSDGYSTEYHNTTCNTYSYGLRVVLSLLPSWFRFAQCCRRYHTSKKAFPHLVNAGKYSTAFFVVALTASLSLYSEKYSEMNMWIFAFLAFVRFGSTIYCLAWDLRMDWGLFSANKESCCLREEMVYPKKAFYYSAIIGDILLRLTWVPGLVNQLVYFADSIYLTTISAILEVFRRFIWNYFRLENEHLNNCGEFRATRDISIAPMEEDYQVLLCEMMDNPDLVTGKKTPCYSHEASGSLSSSFVPRTKLLSAVRRKNRSGIKSSQPVLPAVREAHN